MTHGKSARFTLGRIVATRNAVASIRPDDIRRALARHASGDWGEIDAHDRRENEFAMAAGFRILSLYRDSNGTRFWIITEADRSATTVLLPEDY